MTLAPRITAFVVLAVALAAVFIRLGVWQLDRRDERRAQNDSTRAALRYVTISGAPDWSNEFVVTGRSRNGSPGVHIFTPVHLPRRDRVVLVNRGWVYSPDAATVDLMKWRETRSEFTGYVQQLPRGKNAALVRDRGMRPLQIDGVQRMLPYTFDTTYVVARDTAATGAVASPAGATPTPVQLDEPDLTEGPHFSYAIQWFCFAAIALVGAGVVVRKAQGLPRPGEGKPVA